MGGDESFLPGSEGTVGRDIPFQRPAGIVGESKGRVVGKYPDQKLVVKFPKKETVPVDIELTRREDEVLRRWEDEFSKAVVERGGDRNVVVPERIVIGGTGKKDARVYRVQKLVEDAVLLGKLGTGRLLNLPDKTLVGLRSIFLSTIDLWRKDGVVADVVGSVPRETSLANKIVRHMFPLFTSTSITVDSNGDDLRFIDLGRTDLKNAPLKIRLRSHIDLIGSVVSVGVLDAILVLRNLFGKSDIKPRVLE